MRELFPEYYQLTTQQLEDLSSNAVIAFDASFLLDLYRYSTDTTKDMFSVLEGLGEQVWLPHQAALEFHRNRLNVLASLRSRHAELLRQLKVDGEKLISGINNACLKHPLLDATTLIDPLQTALEQTDKSISAVSDKHPKATLSLEEDPIWSKLVKLFDKKIGPEYSLESLSAIENEGGNRFKRFIPPGYKDKEKDYPFGDFIIWRQLIDYCKQEKRPAFFVTSDVKQDWWLDQNGKKLGPLPALRKEFRSLTNQEFHLYETTHFLRVYAPKYKVSPEKSLDEIRKVRAQRNGPRTVAGELSAASNNSIVSDYITERNSLMNRLSNFNDSDTARQAARLQADIQKMNDHMDKNEFTTAIRKELEMRRNLPSHIVNLLDGKVHMEQDSTRTRLERELNILILPPDDM